MLLPYFLNHLWKLHPIFQTTVFLLCWISAVCQHLFCEQDQPTGDWIFPGISKIWMVHKQQAYILIFSMSISSHLQKTSI